MYQYPRLDSPAALELLAEYSDLGVGDLQVRSAFTHRRVQWYPTATNRVEEKTLRALRDRVIDVAQQHGFPRSIGLRSPAMTGFDREVGPALYDAMDILPADAAHEGVWSFVSLVVLPDVAFWRFPNRDRREEYERLLGRPRNVFRRLWWRCHIFGTAEGSPAERLLEDEAVAILERPTLGGDPRVASAIAKAHLSRLDQDSPGSRTMALREAMKRFRRLSSLVVLGALDDSSLRDTVCEVFDAI